MTGEASRDYLDATRRLVELTIGRPLRHAEQVVDVFGLTRALDDAKERLHTAIEAEKGRAIRRMTGSGHPVKLVMTRPMLTPLEQLYRLGKTEAYAELQRAGYQPVRAYTDPQPAETDEPALAEQAARLLSGLNGLSVRLQMEADARRVVLEARDRGSVAAALAEALLRVPGGKAIAAGLVSKTLFTGMGQTFEANASIVNGWEQTAVLDGGTCGPCEAADGTEFDTWEDAQATMPDGGPYIDCDGGDRCRCRLAPKPM